MKDAYARYMISIGPKPGCGLTEKGYEVLEEALDSELANALDEALEAFSVALPQDVADAVQMKWQEVPTTDAAKDAAAPPTMLGQPISWDDARRISKDGP